MGASTSSQDDNLLRTPSRRTRCQLDERARYERETLSPLGMGPEAEHETDQGLCWGQKASHGTLQTSKQAWRRAAAKTNTILSHRLCPLVQSACQHPSAATAARKAAS